mgnify:CR=1 FL=1
MADAFDFEEYYVNEKIKTEAAIDRSGVIVQNPTENAEAATNNVVYYVAALFYKFNETDLNYSVLPDNCRICVAEQPASDYPATYYYLKKWHRLGEVGDIGISSTWDPKKERESRFVADAGVDGFTYQLINDGDGNSPGHGVYISSFYAIVYPRHETEINDGKWEGLQIQGDAPTYPINQSVVQDPKMMKLLYGALGLYGGRWKSLKWLNKVMNGKGLKDNAVISYDRFKKCMDRLADYCSEADVGFSVTYYDQSFADEVTVDDATKADYKANRLKAMAIHRAYMAALKAADRTKTDMGSNTSFTDAYTKYLPPFLAKPDLVYPVGDAAGNTTALIPPVKTAIKAYFYDAEELEDNFSTLFKSVMDALSRVPFVWRFVSDSTKGEIRAAEKRYTDTPTGSPRMVFDMDIIYGAMLDMSAFRYTPLKFRALPRLIQVGLNDAGECRIVGANRSAIWNMTKWYARNGVDKFTTFADCTNAVNKAYTTISSDELIDLLVDYYNAAVAAGSIDSVHVDKATIHTAVTNYDGVLATPAGTPEREANERAYWEWWNGATGLFGAWFLNVCGYMNYFKDNAVDQQKPGDGIQLTNVERMDLLYKQFDATDTTNNPTWVLPRGEYDVMAWEIPVDLSRTSWPDDEYLVPEHPPEWNDIASNPYENFGSAVVVVDAMHDAYRQMVRATTVQAIVLGPVSAARAALELSDISDDLDELRDICNKLMWYQRVVEESPFTNKSTIDGLGDATLTSSFPAHLMFPVKMYKKVRVKYRKWGRTRHKMVKRSIGVRWAEVTFTDAAVFGEYPVVDEEPGEIVNFRSEYSIETNETSSVIYLNEPLPASVMTAGRGEMNFVNQTASFTVNNELSVIMDDVLMDDPGTLVSIKIPLPPSQPDGSREPVSILYKMPGLPYDSEIRKRAFSDYGSLSQSKTFEVIRNTGIDPTGKKDGWKIFHPSSNNIADLREGIGIHDKVAMLLSILKHEFGGNRVQLIETYRSMDDQASMCSGGPESAFLSWHNYGLAAKILILKNDGKTPMEKTDENDMQKLVEVAKAFTAGCLAGNFGAPCNLVWCGRLAVGPSIFDWEFLPIGVGHKDAPKFRDMMLSQMDPVHELGYVDVDTAGYVKRNIDEGYTDPYVLSDSQALAKAVVCGGHRFMNPLNIRNFNHVSDIVLYDVKEYINLIKLKMSANGTGMPESGNIYDWKAINQDACDQLVRYFAMIGSVAASKTLLAGDFVERYMAIDEQYADMSPVDYVKGMLGNLYTDIRVCIERDGTSSYITLHDGIMHIKALETYPNNPPTRFDMHKQQRVDSEHMLWGTWHDGVFYSEEERPVPYVDSEKPVLGGYVDGECVGGEGMLLHQLIAAQVHKKYIEIKKKFENYGGNLMYDHFEDSPNSGMYDMLENEFGLIKAQDLIPFDTLEMMLFGVGVGDQDGFGRNKVKVDGSIYEKVVNNAQLAGIRRADLTKEHLHIKDTPSKDDGKSMYDRLMKGKGYMANDLI